MVFKRRSVQAREGQHLEPLPAARVVRVRLAAVAVGRVPLLLVLLVLLRVPVELRDERGGRGERDGRERHEARLAVPAPAQERAYLRVHLAVVVQEEVRRAVWLYT